MSATTIRDGKRDAETGHKPRLAVSELVDIHVRLRRREHDYVLRLAAERDQSICKVIRHLIRAAMGAVSTGRKVGPQWDQQG